MRARELVRWLGWGVGLGSVLLSGCSHGELEPAELAKLERAIPAPASAPQGRTNNRARRTPAGAALGRYLFFSDSFTAQESAQRHGVVLRPRSCASCHIPSQGFHDGDRLSTQGALPGFTTGRNTPNIQYSTSRYFLFWNGRADSAWSQALGPLEHPVEMGSNRLRVVKTLAGDPALATAYAGVFGPLPDLAAIPFDDALPQGTDLEPLPREVGAMVREWESNWARLDASQKDEINLAFANVGKAMAAYEDLLAVRDAPFDRFMAAIRGGTAIDDQTELNAQALTGLALFVEEGCLKCHGGPDFTDDDFHDIGSPDDPGLDGGWRAGAAHAVDSPFNCRGPYAGGCGDQGERNLVRATRQRRYRIMDHAVRTPSLRQLGETAPYGSVGQFETLEDVVDFYVRLPEPDPAVRPKRRDRRRNKLLDMLTFNTVHAADLTPSEAEAMVAFLRTLDSPPPCEDLTSAPQTPSDPIDAEACGL